MSVILAVVGPFAYCGYVLYDGFREHSGRDVDSYRGLPPEARHIFFRRTLLYHCYAFEISESGFTAWVKEAGFTDKPVYPVDTSKHVHFSIDESLTIEADIEDEILIQNDESHYKVRYDRKRHRAFYEWAD